MSRIPIDEIRGAYNGGILLCIKCIGANIIDYREDELVLVDDIENDEDGHYCCSECNEPL